MPRKPSTKRVRGLAGNAAGTWPAAVSKALGHPLRIDILRGVDRAGGNSPSAMAATSPGSLGNVAYHVRELHTAGLLKRTRRRPVRGALENFYELTDLGAAALKAVEVVLELDPGDRAPTKRRRRTS